MTPLPATALPTPFATPTTAAGEAAPPPPSGDADIVFVLNHTLALINADGSNLRRLAITGDLSQPRWSPDKCAHRLPGGLRRGRRPLDGQAATARTRAG